VALVREWTMPTERPPTVGEVVPNLWMEGVAWSAQLIPMVVNVEFLDQSRYFFFQGAPQLSSRGWVDPAPDWLLLRKSGSARNRTHDLWICSQKLWPLDHRDGQDSQFPGWNSNQAPQARSQKCYCLSLLAWYHYHHHSYLHLYQNHCITVCTKTSISSFLQYNYNIYVLIYNLDRKYRLILLQVWAIQKRSIYCW
jgi:hypothetical protein